MNYLFFDIECCDGHNICEFGYMLTDEKFNILEKKDLLINPEKPFNLKSDNNQFGIELFYKEEEYNSGEIFTKHYKTIKELIEKENQMIIGHSLINDANFLNTACERYSLSPINFNFYDSQRMFIDYFDSEKTNSLESICEELKLDVNGRFHKSTDDAEFSMLCVKKLCELNNCNVHELIELCPSCIGFSKNLKAEYVKLSIDKILELVKIKPNRISQSLKEDTILRLAPINRNGKVISCSTKLFKDNFVDFIKVMKYLNTKGYSYTNIVSQCNYFIKFDEYENNKIIECGRLKSVRMNIREGRRIKVCDFNYFLKMVGLSDQLVDSLPLPIEDDFDSDNKTIKKIIKENVGQNSFGGGATIGEILRASKNQK